MVNPKRSSARTGGPAVRLPSVSYGAAVAGAAEGGGGDLGEVQVARFGLDFVSSSARGPLAWTGQPRWTQRFEISVKLGTPGRSSPLFRT